MCFVCLNRVLNDKPPCHPDTVQKTATFIDSAAVVDIRSVSPYPRSQGQLTAVHVQPQSEAKGMERVAPVT